MGLVRIQKESKPAMDTHLLERVEVGTLDTRCKQASKRHSQTTEYRIRSQHNTNKQAQTDKILSVNCPSARDNFV